MNFKLFFKRYWEMFLNYKDYILKIEKCIEENQKFLFDIVSYINEMFENRDYLRIFLVSI